jgi:hypothetical protein
MPTTSRAYRYPASSATPNVAQDLQNLASDINADLSSPWVVTVDSGPSGIIGVTQSTYTNLTGLSQNSVVAVPTGKRLEVDFAAPIGSVNGGFVFVQLVIGGTPSEAMGASGTGVWWRPKIRFEAPGTGAVMTYSVQGYITAGSADVRGTGGTIRMRHRIV